MVIEALDQALGQREVKPEQLLIDTDRGSQYTVTDYQKFFKDRKITCSMSGGQLLGSCGCGELFVHPQTGMRP